MFIYLEDCKIVPGYRTDHSGLVLKLNFFEQERGEGYWKFNNSLLKDKAYVEIVHKTITEVLNLHLKDKEKQIDSVHNSSFAFIASTGYTYTKDRKNKEEFTITDQLLLETILMMIRGETIKYSSYKKKNNEKKKGN